MKTEIKTWIWVPCKTNLFKPAYILKEEDNNYTVQSDTVEIFKIQETFQINPGNFDKIDDLAHLSFLNEPSVLHNLKMRFKDDLIYTNSGLFLIAVNPYKAVFTPEGNSIYDDTMKDGATGPHIYRVAAEAYRSMINNKRDQSILITGESGAGKTENTKRVIEYFAYTNKHCNQEELLSANPILEAFGNAKTVKNDNSSRFGKFIQLWFGEDGFVGCGIQKFLLEKSRLISQSPGERNYHIFYYLIHGATPELKEQLHLRDEKDYRCISHPGTAVKGLDCKVELQKLEASFSKLGISSMKYYKIVSGLLNLSNIDFHEDTITNLDDLDTACLLLDLNKDRFIEFLQDPTLRAGTELVKHKRSQESNLRIVQGFMKHVYDCLFDTILGEINKVLCTKGSHFIGVLDIAGFEIFETNSFEQLLINYTNEKLQQLFNNYMFQKEQETYKKENIPWDFIDFGLDLEPVIQVLEGSNPIGVLSYLDEVCVMPCCTEETFLQKLHKISSPCLQLSKLRDTFLVRHYAGEVEYEVDGWLHKNKDTSNDEIFSLFKLGTATVTGKRGIFRTVSQSHKENLKSLMSLLRGTDPHFVRCLLPNLNKSPKEFDMKLLLSQLKCNGVLEGIRISRIGYPNKILFSDFIARYSLLSTDSSTDTSPLDLSVSIKQLAGNILLDHEYKIGNSMIFLKQGVLGELEFRRESYSRNIMKLLIRLIKCKVASFQFNLFSIRMKNILVVQENARASLLFLRSPWWRLFLKIKPLLDVNQKDAILLKRDKEIQQLKAENSAFQDTCHEQDSQLLELRKMLQNIKGEFDFLVRLKNTSNSKLTEYMSNCEYLCNILNLTENKISNLISEFMHLTNSNKTKEQIILELRSQVSLIKKENEVFKINEINFLKENHDGIIKSKEAEIEQLKSEVSELSDSRVHNQKLQKDLKFHLSQISTLEAENEKLSLEYSESRELVKKYKEDIECYLVSTNRIEAVNSKLNKEISVLSGAVKLEKSKQSALVNDFDLLKSKFELVNGDYTVLLEQHETLVKECQNNSNTESKTQKKKIRELNDKLAAEAEITRKLEKEKEELLNENALLSQSKLNALFSHEEEKKMLFRKHESELSILRNENSLLKSELQDKTSSIEEKIDVDERLCLLYDNEVKLRKNLESKIIEIENDNFKLTNSLKLQCSELEQAKDQLLYLQNCCSEASKADKELASLKNNLQATKAYLDKVLTIFQVNFFNILKDKEHCMNELVEQLEEQAQQRLTGELELIESNNCKKDLRDAVILNEKLKDDIDSVSVELAATVIKNKELETHVGLVVDQFNSREKSISSYISKLESKAAEFDNSSRILNSKIAMLDEAMTSDSAEISQLRAKILDLSSQVLLRDMEIKSLKKKESLFTSLQADISSLKPQVNIESAVQERLVSVIITDKDAYKVKAKENLVKCKCNLQYLKSLENRDDSLISKLENEISLLNLKLAQHQRMLNDQNSILDNLRNVAVRKLK